MQPQILIEQLSPTEANIMESVSEDGKDCWLSGIFMQAEIQNRNGRTYPLTEIGNAVTTAQARITEQKGIFGELDHPQSLQINLDRISHVITEINMNGSNAVGKAKMLNTPMGQIVKGLLEGGVQLGVSTRGMGSLENRAGTTYVKADYMLNPVDIVQDPSAP